MSKTSAHTLHRVAQRTQPARPAPTPQPPLRLVTTTPISLTKMSQAAAEHITDTTLPVREFITEAAITAHYRARLSGLPTTRIRDWIAQPDGTAQTDRGPRGTLTHNPNNPTPFTATIPCAANAHTYPITTGRDLRAAEHAAQDCHSDHGAHTAPPSAPRARDFGHALHRAHASAADTERTDVATLRATHAADNDLTKEHPQP